MAEETTNQGNIKLEYNLARTGLNMDQSVNQIEKGQLSYALNASLENFDANSINYQNEPSNEFCLNFPSGYQLIGEHFINEQNKHIFFLVNSETGGSEIGYMDNNDCIYHTYINAPCLNFSINYPIHKAVHKITNCTTEIYWTDGFNPRRFLDLTNLPYKIKPGTDVCDNETIPEVDCNKIKVQPNFNVPQLSITDVISGGNLLAGTYQFAIQYCDSVGSPFTSYYSVTNPTPIYDPQITTLNFNYPVGRSIVVNIQNIDITGYYQYFNLAVIKTINGISSVELVGTYYIDKSEKSITYTGQNVTNIRLTVDDIFEKYAYYDIAQDVTSAQDILIWDNLTSIDRINYQQIANRIALQWETWRIPSTEDYGDELNATNLRGYLRDEVYAFEIVFLLRNGKQTDGFHIPGRPIGASDNPSTNIPEFSPDFIGEPTFYQGGVGYSPYWKIYNTAYKLGNSQGRTGDANYKGPWEYGEFAYWESTETYPCNEEVWGELSNQPIRHHKFPDVLVSPIFETPTISYLGTSLSPAMVNDAIYPIGVKIDTSQIISLIQQSGLTTEQKDNIVGYKIVRGDRGTNKSIVAKGMLRNVGKYKRQEQEYYYPNYPYNDIKTDPFLLAESNAFQGECQVYRVDVTTSGSLEYVDCITGERTTMTVEASTAYEICSLSKPTLLFGTTASFNGLANYTLWELNNNSLWQGAYFNYINPETPDTLSQIYVSSLTNFVSCTPNCCPGQNSAVPSGSRACVNSIIKPERISGAALGSYITPVQTYTATKTCGTAPLKGFETDESKYRYVFNSPETSFGQPFLGNILKLESVMYGGGRAHFVKVQDHAKYKFLTKEAQVDALNASYEIGAITGSSASDFSAQAMFAAYQSYITIYVNGITRKNYSYSFNSIASYDYAADILNGQGIKQRMLDIKAYMIPAVQSFGDTHPINNWYRESSVYLRTNLNKPALPYAENTPSLMSGTTSLMTDDSRFVLSDRQDGCQTPEKQRDIRVVSYYGSMKNEFINQWGQMYSYDTIDTGFQVDLDSPITNSTIFGGDTFITRFAYKIKLPFFIDWRVNAPDDSDVFYDEIGNVAYPKYWFSSRSILDNAVAGGTGTSGVNILLPNYYSYKAHNFDCPNSQEPKDNNPGRTFYDGKMYLFAYGIPNFYCETSYNVDLRQAFNDREGNFWPHVSTDIPDDWVQEKFVTIAQDNTYYYNVTYSKQNKENYFSHLPIDWSEKLCYTNFPFKAIYSDVQTSYAEDASNNWLIYRPLSFHDFPQNYGKLTSLDGIQNKAVLARFENKTLLYNSLLTIDTSNPKAAYVGNNRLFDGAPPIDFAETDLGYVGCQNKMFLKIPQGQVTADAKRGQIFLVQGSAVKDLSGYGSGMNRFFTDHLAFEILRYFPTVNIDNHFKGLGLHGVYDSKFDRVILTKLDYIPKEGVDLKYDDVADEFYVEEEIGCIDPVTTTSTSSSSTSTTSSTSTSSTTTSSTSSTSTTTSTTTAGPPPEYRNFYTALIYDCTVGCVSSVGTAVITVPYPFTLTVGQYYKDSTIADNVYRVISGALAPAGYIANPTPYANCTFACEATPPPI